MRKRFDQQLEELNVELIKMGSLCERAIRRAVELLQNPEDTRVSDVDRIEEEVNHKEREIETLCMKLLLQQQPVARDLRQISAALKMITDLERIGDQAEDIAEIVISGQVNEGEELLRDMAASTIKMVTESVDAYVKHDTMLAEKVIAEDDIVDDWFDRVKHTLIRRMTTDPGEGERAVDLLMIAKYFERIGDHAVNVAQWVIFSVTGTHKEG